MQQPFSHRRSNDFLSHQGYVDDLQAHKRIKNAPQWRNQPVLDYVIDYVYSLASLQNIELEFRVGQLNGKEFIPSLPMEDFQTILASIKKISKASKITDYYYQRARVSVSEEGKITGGIHKERIVTFDMGTNLPQDIRVAISRETPLLPLPVSINKGYSLKRTKTRYSLFAQDWVLDLSEVLTEGESSPTFELEVEVKLPSLCACKDFRASVALLESVFVEVHNLLARLVKPGARVFSDLKLQRVIRPAHALYLREELHKLVPNVFKGSTAFPGSQPVDLQRSKFKVIQQGKYWVSEKSDGVRYMLFFIDGTAYLVDRKMQFYQIHKFRYVLS